jgi:hypothetical protein
MRACCQGENVAALGKIRFPQHLFLQVICFAKRRFRRKFLWTMQFPCSTPRRFEICFNLIKNAYNPSNILQTGQNERGNSRVRQAEEIVSIYLRLEESKSWQ